jgi:hypothetical protein
MREAIYRLECSPGFRFAHPGYALNDNRSNRSPHEAKRNAGLFPATTPTPGFAALHRATFDPGFRFAHPGYARFDE